MSTRLPHAIAYELPTEYPSSAAPWQIDPDRAVLLVHDMQRYFVDVFTAGADPIVTVVGHTAALIRCARATGIPVVFTAQSAAQTDAERGLLTDMWGTGIQGKPEGEPIIEALAPADGEKIIDKFRYSAFAHNDFAEHLHQLGRDQIIITGIYASIGCAVTAVEGFMRDMQCFFVADAVGDFCRRDHEATLRWVAGRAGVVVPTARALRDMVAVVPTIERLIGESLSDCDPDEDDLDDWGLDSVRFMSLMSRLTAAGLSVTVEDVAEDPTLTGVQRAVHNAIARACASTTDRL